MVSPREKKKQTSTPTYETPPQAKYRAGKEPLGMKVLIERPKDKDLEGTRSKSEVLVITVRILSKK